MKFIQLSTIASLAIFATAPGVSAQEYGYGNRRNGPTRNDCQETFVQSTGASLSPWASTAPIHELETKCQSMFGITGRNVDVDGPTRNDCAMDFTWAAGAATGEPYSQWARTAPEREIEKKCRQMFGMTVRNNVDGPTRNDCRKAFVWVSGAATGEPYSQWARTAPNNELEKKCRQMFGISRGNVDGPTRNDCDQYYSGQSPSSQWARTVPWSELKRKCDRIFGIAGDNVDKNRDRGGDENDSISNGDDNVDVCSKYPTKRACHHSRYNHNWQRCGWDARLGCYSY